MAGASQNSLGKLRMPVSAHHQCIGVKSLCCVDEPFSDGLAETVGILNTNLQAVPSEMRRDVEPRRCAMLTAKSRDVIPEAHRPQMQSVIDVAMRSRREGGAGPQTRDRSRRTCLRSILQGQPVPRRQAQCHVQEHRPDGPHPLRSGIGEYHDAGIPVGQQHNLRRIAVD
jgi:hypothetical protein